MMTTTTTKALSPRPIPPNEQTSSKVLHPIYQSLDSHNYSKALKLTSSSSPSSEWDIVKALRIHALERTGKKREALLLLWEVLTNGVVLSGGNDSSGDGGSNQAEEVWWELRERIQSVTDAADLVSDGAAHGSGGNAAWMDPVERLDLRGFACVARAGISRSGNANANVDASSAGATPKTFSKGKSSKGSKHSNNGGDTSKTKRYPPVTDDTVLSTLAVTLRIEGLYATLSEMYFQATEEAIAPSTGEMNTENLQSVLEEAVCVHFRSVCDCSSVEKKPSDNGYCNNHNTNGEDNSNGKSQTSERNGLSDEQLRCKLPNLKTLLQLTTYYERMQTSSLQLSKLSGESLHFQWTAISSLWYKDSLVELVELLQTFSNTLAMNGDADNTDVEHSQIPSSRRHRIQQQVCSMLKIRSPSELQPMIQKLKQKVALLPRLAESLSSRMVKNKQHRQEQNPQGPSSQAKQIGYGPSENDWDVYLETLLHQHKKEEALEALKGIPCSPMTHVIGDDDSGGNGADTNTNDNTCVLPQIHDEHTIENHIGSVLPYTQRKKLERLSEIALELGKYEESARGYRELLRAFPDQWTYWMGLVDSLVLLGTPRELVCGTETKRAVNRDGWNSCRAFAKEVIASLAERKGGRSLRGPYLVLIELEAVKVLAESGCTVVALREEICSYGDRFGPLASCCFADIRPYLRLLVQSTVGVDGADGIPDEVSELLVWAKNIWMENSQANTDAGNGKVSAEELRERRKKLRAYIFAVQVVYCVTADLGVGCTTLQLYSPSIPQMTSEWRTSLTFLPGVAPKDGGQKEILPGDEVILLITQYLQYQTSCESQQPKTHNLIAAAALLEQAMDHSPYNPHLKIAAIGVYSQLHAAHRALSIYNDLGVKQIQLDSCSYLILPLLVRGGLYTSAIELSSSILRLHGSTSKDVKDYASKSFQNGYLLKAKEMVTFQREKMRPSLQLLHSKGIVMDCAALMNASDLNGGLASKEPRSNVPAVKLGEVRGLCGGEGDLAKAEKLITDSESHFNAPSLIHDAARTTSLRDFAFSDNRDMTMNYFEILYQNRRLTEKEMMSESLMRGHIHGMLVRAVMLSGVAKAPKKGKVPKCSEEMTYRYLSLVDALERLNQFSKGHDIEINDLEMELLELLCALCQAIATIVVGKDDDSMAEREKTVVSIIESGTKILGSVRDSFKSFAYNTIDDQSGTMVCQLLPDRVVPTYILIETTTTLFALFGWGKRKRKTKPAAAALAELALSFRDLLSDLMHATSLFRAFGDENNSTDVELLIKNALDSIIDRQADVAATHCEDHASVRRAINEVSVSRSMTTDRVDPFLVEMWENLGSFDETE